MQGFRSVTFLLADTDLLDTNPPENKIKFKNVKVENLLIMILIIVFRNNRENYIKTEL